ncbi:MAG: hypothetical protein ACWA5A_19220 [Marinibacterium sp.]
MEQVVTLAPDENVRLDFTRLEELYIQLGEVGAEDVVCRAVEELAQRLAHCEDFWRRGEVDNLRKCARSLVAIADQVGLAKMARVAKDVTASIDAGDRVAISATLGRLARIGARSLAAVWDLQDLSV